MSAKGPIESPSRAQIERMALTANRAPSAENCQPWHFRWDGQALTIEHDPERARHALNHRDDVSRLALGGVLEALSIAARAEGWSAEPALSLHGPARSIWATVRFSPAAPATPADRALLPAVEARATDRRIYRGGSLSHPVFAEIQRDAARFPGAGLHLLDRFSPALVRFIVAADASIWRDDAAYRDVTRWVRFSQKELDEAGDGVPFASAGVYLPESQIFRLAKLSFARGLAERLGLLPLARLWVERQLKSSAGLLMITVRDPSREAMIEAGRLAFSMWIRLNRNGFGVHPMTIQALPVYHAATADLRPGTPPSDIGLFRDARPLLERAFGYPQGELPVWMFRTGLSSPPPPSQRTRRLPLTRIFSSEAPAR
ncbi:MAG: hypothetical protein U0359_13050 [Byssovorax sp.]